MILMVCGTQKFQLDRMLLEMDRLIESGAVTEPVFAQTGHSGYEPKHYQWARFVPGEEFEEKIRNCDLLLTHGGVGTILSGKEWGKPVLIYPRSAAYGEHVDDHQWQIAREFRKRDYALICEDTSQMAQRIDECRHFPFRQMRLGKNIQTGVIRNFLQGKQPVGNEGMRYGKEE